MTDFDAILDGIEQLADAATSGDWVAPISSPECVVVPAGHPDSLPWTVASTQTAADARYFAAVQPKVLKALIAQYRAMATELAERNKQAPTADLNALRADAVNLAAERSPFGHPLPDSEIRAAWAGVDAVLAAITAEA